MRAPPAWLAPATEAGRPIREAWRRRHLRLAGIVGPERLVAQLAVATILVAGAIVVATSMGLHLPGLVTLVPGRTLANDTPVAVPSLAIALACIGMAVAAAAIAIASIGPGVRPGRSFVVLELTLAGLGGLVLATAGAVRFLASQVEDPNGLAVTPYVATGILGLASAALLALLVLVGDRRWTRIAAPLIAVAPFAGLLTAILLAGDQHATVRPWLQAQFPDYPPTLYLTATIFGPVVFVIGSAAGLVALLTIWQASEFSKATARHLGTALAASTRSAAWLLPALLGAKLAWLAAGLLGALPPAIGGTAGTWASLRSDDWFAWAWAAAIAGGAGTWLALDRGLLNESRAQRAAGRIVVIFSASALLLAALPLAGAALAGFYPGTYPALPDSVGIGECLRTWVPLGFPAGAACLAHVVLEWQSTWWLLVVVAALVVGIAILRRHPHDAGGIFLAAVGAWALPRALNAARQLPPPDLPQLASLPALNAPQPETLDVIVTILVAVLGMGWWLGRERRLGPGPLTVVLVVFTVVVHAPAVAPTAPTTLLLSLAIVFPALYELGFDSGDLNRPGRDRLERVLRGIGLRAFALTVLATLVVVDIGELRESSQVQLGFLLFGIPLAATVAAAAARRVARREERPPGPSGQIPIRDALAVGRPVLVGAAAGVAGLTLLIALGWLFQPGLARLYPSPADRVAELRARYEALDEHVQSINVADPATPATLVTRWESESAWTAANPGPDCAREVWRDWTTYIDDVREAGIVIGAFSDAPQNPPQQEIDAVSAALTRVGRELGEDAATVLAKLDTAAESCSAP